MLCYLVLLLILTEAVLGLSVSQVAQPDCQQLHQLLHTSTNCKTKIKAHVAVPGRKRILFRHHQN